ncbi:MAG: DUF2318 domain-containing protein [Clostridiales Family XIII bacterium]|nr:DUF2318 domain-containing protein [Clostridiales Family XIII bacterium]
MFRIERKAQRKKYLGYRWAAVLLVLILLFTLTACGAKNAKEEPPENTGSAAEGTAVPQTAPEEEPEEQAAPETAPVPEGDDLVIPISGLSETAVFYPVDVDGVALEVLAVKASDGTIRTAFNTCQVCFSSGRGYYKQDGDVLVCQNCGNRFKMDQVEVVSGGCNPVPIFDENKVTDDENITIPFSYLYEARAIFENWKA